MIKFMSHSPMLSRFFSMASDIRVMRRRGAGKVLGLSESRTGIMSSGNRELKRENDGGHFYRNLIIFGAMLLTCVLSARYFFSVMPDPNGDSCNEVSLGFLVKGVLPTQVGGRNDKLGTLRTIMVCVEDYRQEHPLYAVACFAIVYISLQAFAIPGPIILSILAGALYEPIPAQILVSFCATTGASLCFFMSYCLGAPIMNRLFPAMMRKYSAKIEANRPNLWYYLLFLRITPLLPNWFVNVASPIGGVPAIYFMTATFIGLIPANFLHATTGATLATVAGSSGDDGNVLGNNAFNFSVLFTLQFVALLPTLFKRRIEAYEKKAF